VVEVAPEEEEEEPITAETGGGGGEMETDVSMRYDATAYVPACVVVQVHAEEVQEAALSMTSVAVPAMEASVEEPGMSEAVVPTGATIGFGV
jgi:hypothetical protein